MAALQYAHVPRYAALILRRKFVDLILPGAILNRAEEWLIGQPGVRYVKSESRFEFENGGSITFGHLDTENDKYKYQGAEFQFIGFDELTQFTETQYRYLLSRVRRAGGLSVPLRVRAGANPGGEGHEWVRRRFLIEGLEAGRPFIPARLTDNPHLDQVAYMAQLAELDPVTRAQLEQGDWEIVPKGPMFDRVWFEIVDRVPAGRFGSARYWDLAATKPKPGRDPDYTAGARVWDVDGVWYVEDIRYLRSTPGDVEALVRHTATIDGYVIPIGMEQEPGSSGVNTIDNYSRKVLRGYAFYGEKKTGDKTTLARPLSSAAQAGLVKLVRGGWNGQFLDECTGFPLFGHDDGIDAVTGAMRMLTTGRVPLSSRHSPDESDDDQPKFPRRF